MFETRSQAWKEVGLLRQISPRVVKRARLEALVLVPLFVGIVIVYDNRVSLFGSRTSPHAPLRLEPGIETPLRVVTVVALVILGWAIARDVGRGLGPPLFRRLDPATAGTVGFLIRLVAIGLALLVALRVAGFEARELALGTAFTAVIFGLAAQQTLGNLIAGLVLLSARPFRVGDRVRLQGGPLAGQLEGTVSALGLLYTTFASGEDAIMVPNSVVLNVAVMPLREPDAVNLRARLRAGMTPEICRRSWRVRCRRRCAVRHGSPWRSSTATKSWCRSRRRHWLARRAVTWRVNCSRSSLARRTLKRRARRSAGTARSRR